MSYLFSSCLLQQCEKIYTNAYGIFPGLLKDHIHSKSAPKCPKSSMFYNTTVSQTWQRDEILCCKAKHIHSKACKKTEEIKA